MRTYADELLRPFAKASDLMEDRIRTGVERYRKGYGQIEILGEQGEPVPGAHVEIMQDGHAFGLGANLFLLDELPEQERNAAYRERFAGLFNRATLPFYWGDLEPEQGKPRFSKDSPKIFRRPAPDLCLAFCQAHGILPKGHCLVYEPFAPAWLPRQDVRAIKALYDRRIAEIAERYAADIPAWEVTNETLYNTHRFGYSAFFFADDHVPWSFACARRHLPTHELIINEGQDRAWLDFHGNRSQYYLQIENLLLRGVPVDGVGMQYHMWSARADAPRANARYYDPEHLYAVMDCYGRLGLPLQVTEITIPCFDESEAMEDLQAEILRNLYRIWFSHEAMEAVYYWNLMDGGAFGTENEYRAGIVAEDGTPKAAYRALRELFAREWRTRLETRTDDRGQARFKGFYGDYTIRVTADGRTQSFPMRLQRDGLGLHRILLQP